jgi:hypothetical protein
VCFQTNSRILTLARLPMHHRGRSFGGHEWSLPQGGRTLKETGTTYEVTVDGYAERQTCYVYEFTKGSANPSYGEPHAIQPPSSVAEKAVYDVASQALPPTMSIDSDEDAKPTETDVPAARYRPGDPVGVTRPDRSRVDRATIVSGPTEQDYYQIQLDKSGGTRDAHVSDIYPAVNMTKVPKLTAKQKALSTFGGNPDPPKRSKKAAKHHKTGAKLVTIKTHTSEVRHKGPRSYSCALQCFSVICHAFDCEDIMTYLMDKFAKRAKGAQLDMYKINKALLGLAFDPTLRQNYLAVIPEPPEDQVPLQERKGGPVLYALNQRGVFIFVTAPYPATGVNHAVIYVKLGNTNGATGSQRGTHSCLPPYPGTA